MHWEKSGPQNTAKTVELAVKRAYELKLKHVVVASNSGRTAEYFYDYPDLNLVVITHQVGFRGPGEDEMPQAKRAELQAKNFKVLTTTHLMAGVDRAVRNSFGGLYPGELMAHSLRMLGQGVKVGVEISVMALDGGLIPHGEDIIAVGGSGKGADTAMVIRPEHSQHIFRTKIREIICMPR